jgi:hypothetical protein
MTLCTISKLHFYYAESHYAECRYTECRYAACRYAKCRGAIKRVFLTSIPERGDRDEPRLCGQEPQRPGFKIKKRKYFFLLLMTLRDNKLERLFLNVGLCNVE